MSKHLSPPQLGLNWILVPSVDRAVRVGGHLVVYEANVFWSGNFEALLVIFVGLQLRDKVCAISFHN